MKVDINCDLGENEPPARTEELMRLVSSANIACGGHAGNVESMKACLRMAEQHGVKIGAHPGLPDRAGFGRGEAKVTAAELRVAVLQQVSALETLTTTIGTGLHHVKLHGALYHLTEDDAELRDGFLSLMEECWPSALLYALAGGKVVEGARARGLRVWEEAFLDRGYLASGRLVPRGQAGALIESETEMRERLLSMVKEGRVKCVDGTFHRLHPQTLCIHADSAIPVPVLAGLLKG